jgi:hypothetical protein
MVRVDAKTRINKRQSKITSSALRSGAKIKIEAKYCARTIIGILYPRTTENKLRILSAKILDLRVNILRDPSIRSEQ